MYLRKKTLSVLFILVLVFAWTVGINADCFKTVAASPKLNRTKLSLTKGETATLKVKGAVAKKVKWSSNKKTVATVNSKGCVKALSPGKAIVSAKYSGRTYKCKVTVETIEVEEIELSSYSISIKKGESAVLYAVVSPDDADDAQVSWSSSDTSIATVYDGKISGKGEGSCTITASTSNGVEAECEVTVIVPKVERIVLSKTALSLMKGNKETITATVYPSDAENKTLTWNSSNTSVVSVYSGNITAVGEGTAVVTVSSSNGIKATCNVTVSVVKVDTITLNKTALSMVKGETEYLSATVSPSNAENKSITWSSSNTSVATVSEYGRVTAEGDGTAIITAASSNGVTATCTVTVSVPVKITFPALPLTKNNYNYNNKIEQTYTLTSVTYEYSYNGSSGYTGKIYIWGTKDYDVRGSGQSDSVKVSWKCYQGNTNTVVDSGTIYTQSVAMGESFARSDGYLTVPEPGEYRIEFGNTN